MTTSEDRGANGSGRLATVTFLPGVTPEPGVHGERMLSDCEMAERRVVASVPKSARATPDGSGRVHEAAVRSLARRGLSEWELQQTLERRGVESARIEDELDALRERGLVDDERLAVDVATLRHERKGLSRHAIEEELRRRRFAPEAIEAALETLGDDEGERVRELAHARALKLRGLDDETARRRLYGYLARKGYAGELIRAAVSEALA